MPRKSKPNSPKSLTILSADPGTRTFSVAVTKGNKVLYSGRIVNTIDNLKNDPEDGLLDKTDRYRAEILQLLHKYGPSVVIMERFMARGLRGATGEYVSFMSAITCSLCRYGSNKRHFVYYTAAQWKNKVKELKWAYDYAKKTYKIETHDVDSMMIGLVFSGNYEDTKKWFKQQLKILAKAKK